MLPRSLRLSRAEIEEVVAHGRRFGNRELGLRVLKSGKSLNRLAIVIPSREVKLSTRRHLIKRRLRAIIRSHSSQTPAGCQIVVFCGAATVQWSFRELKVRFAKLLNDLINYTKYDR